MHKSKISVGIRALIFCLALSLCSVFFGDLSYTEAKGATLKETSSKYEFNRLTDNECTELFDSLKTLTKSPTQTKSKRATNAYLIAKLYSVFKDMAPEIDSYAKVPAGYEDEDLDEYEDLEINGNKITYKKGLDISPFQELFEKIGNDVQGNKWMVEII